MSNLQLHTVQLKWHNTLPEDFSAHSVTPKMEHPSKSLSFVGKKRQSSSTEGLNALMIADDHTLNGSKLSLDTGASLGPSVDAFPTKRHRKSSHTKTPIKSSRLTVVSKKASSPGHGIQTPPPSSTGATKRKGRLSQRIVTKSRSGNRALSPPHTSPYKLHASSMSSLNADYHAGKSFLSNGHSRHGDQKALFWDDGLGFGCGDGELAQFDWNLSQENIYTPDFPEMFNSNSLLRTRAISPVHTDTASDSAHFSFMRSDYDDIIPTGVDPNLIFSEPSSAAPSMIDDFRDSRQELTPTQRPYQHQRLQRQREQEERLKRRQEYQAEHYQNLTMRRSYDTLKNGSTCMGISRKPLLSAPTTSRRIFSSPTKYNTERTQHQFQLTNFCPNASLSNKNIKPRMEVVLAISPGGRAQAKTTVVYESDSAADFERIPSGSSGWDSLDESDSSYDGDSPRGLAPDGSKYLSFRKRSASRPVSDQGPKSLPSATKKPLIQSKTTPLTPTKAGDMVTASAASTAATGRTRIDSSPRLPTPRIATPLKSSPPPSLNIPREANACESTSATAQLLNFEDVENSASEAETVVDEPTNPREEDADKVAEGDALAALRKVMSRGRGSVPQLESKTRAIKYHTFSARSRSFGAFRESLYNPFASLSIKVNRRRRMADGGFYHKEENIRNSSPTTITDPDYFSSDRDASDLHFDAAIETRCICHQLDDRGEAMVQCDSCKYWLHCNCLGYSRKSLPKGFVCFYCIDDALPLSHPPLSSTVTGTHTGRPDLALLKSSPIQCKLNKVLYDTRR